jgi:hypothetical protein
MTRHTLRLVDTALTKPSFQVDSKSCAYDHDVELRSEPSIRDTKGKANMISITSKRYQFLGKTYEYILPQYLVRQRYSRSS